MINILFSGINKHTGFSENQAKYIKNDVKNNSNIVIIASTFDVPERNDEHFKRTLEWFNNIGINFSNSSLIDRRMSKEKAKEVLETADVVYLMGGSPVLQMKSISEYELTENIKKVSVIIGVSAGSMNQSKRVVYKDEYENNVILDYEGLGFVDINIYPHVENDDTLLIEETKEVSNYIPLVALPNDSFVRVENSHIEYVGEYSLVHNGIFLDDTQNISLNK